MILTTDEIRPLTHGALSVNDLGNGRTGFDRFTKKGLAVYDGVDDFGRKARAATCIRLEFETDASSFSFCYRTEKACSRFFDFFDITLDGVLIAHPGKDNITEEEGTFRCDLPDGMHRIAIYFPALFRVEISALTFPDGAAVVPVKKERTLLCVGDSITQGYDARFPSQSYVNLITDALNAETVNQGIGAEVFRPDMIDKDMPFDPQYILVAYGTNDWSALPDPETLRDHANEYFRRLREGFPHAAIFAITPVWRAHWNKITKVGSFSDAAQIVRNAAEAVNATVFDGMKLTPHLTDFYSDQSVHPNDLGFRFYASNLLSQLRPFIS